MKLVLIRHGESQWNLENRFTGWTDVDISDKGVAESHQAAKLLQENNFDFDYCYTSLLKRAIRTLWLVLDDLDRLWLPVERTWRLNERHYGALQGLNKQETAQKYGKEQVFIWRRSFNVWPPLLTRDDERHPCHDRRYADLAPDLWPDGESLEATIERTLPFWHETIVPRIRDGQRVLIVAHGNSLRGLVKYLDRLSDEEITKVNIPTGTPLVYELDNELNPINKYYLGDQDNIESALHAVANQGKQ